MDKGKRELKKRSKSIFENIKTTPFNYVTLGIIEGTGIQENEIHNKPFIGVVNTWNELNPGHKHLKDLAEAVKHGIIEAGGMPFEFCTVGPCDGWANGNQGMRYILPQREVIADSIELMVEAHRLDAIVTLSSCDKINPAVLMAALRLDIPTICVPGGPNMYEVRFQPDYKGIEQSNYENFLGKLNCITCGSYGACEIMGTANTIQCLMEAFGMTLPNAATIPAMTRMKYVVAKNSGKQIIKLLEKDLVPSKIMTQESLENAIIVDLAIGGSTNSALHLPAIANEMGIKMDLDLFNEYSSKIPTIVNVSPSGDYGIVDLYKAGGIQAVLKRLKEFLNLDCLTVSGKTIGKQIRRIKVLDDNIIRDLKNPIYSEGGTIVLKGNLAPEGAIIKQSAVKDKAMLKFEGPALCYNSENEVLQDLAQNKIENGSVLIIRYEGPKGGPGMPELLAVTATLMLRANLNKVALITDGRFSGATSGPCIGHVSPEAYVGGPIALIEDGDIISISIPDRSLKVNLTEEILERRLEKWQPFEREIKSKALLKYRKLVSSASEGAIFKL
ncbi:MAG: dihydroxy-acid dehydratase [Candidatus Lokiarchaeota archaeon]|nr:dihydroxy-acid dehydratase [Candidatus Lokiarchaeota archaeon]MBD3337830.1 dihydroxy-acid dehydratase [Candidatus Lokiarchaeota archaeon]